MTNRMADKITDKITGKLICEIAYFFHAHRIERTALILSMINFIVNGHTIVFYLMTFLALCIVAFRNFVTLDAFDYTKTHVFTEFEDPNLACSLKYHGHIPILSLPTKEQFNKNQNVWSCVNGKYISSEFHYCMGYWHGYYMSPYMSSLVCRMKLLSLFVKMPDMNNVEIPDDYRSEMAGLVNGYNVTNPLIRLDYNLVMMYHLLPEIEANMIGCTTLMLPSDSMKMYRNLDWIPYGDLAKYSLVIHYQDKGVYSFAMPGVLGVFTGWNKTMGLSMNVSNGPQFNGLPALFYNRMVLENFKDTFEYHTYYMDRTNQTDRTDRTDRIDHVGRLDNMAGIGNVEDIKDIKENFVDSSNSVDSTNKNLRKFCGLPMTSYHLNLVDCFGFALHQEIYVSTAIATDNHKDILDEMYAIYSDTDQTDCKVGKTDQTDQTDRSSVTDIFEKSYCYKNRSEDLLIGVCGMGNIKLNKDILVFNHRNRINWDDSKTTYDHFFGNERMQLARDLRESGYDGESIIRQMPINNYETCQTMILDPKNSTVKLSWNNGFSASSEFAEFRYNE
jgi:hypothetical protein